MRLALIALVLAAAIFAAQRLGAVPAPLAAVLHPAAQTQPAPAPPPTVVEVVDPTSVVPHFGSGGTFSRMPSGSGFANQPRAIAADDPCLHDCPTASAVAGVPTTTPAPDPERHTSPGYAPPVSPGYVMPGSRKVYAGPEYGYRNAEREIQWEHVRAWEHAERERVDHSKKRLLQ